MMRNAFKTVLWLGLVFILMTCKKPNILEEINLQQGLKISEDEISWYKSVSVQEGIRIPSVGISSGVVRFTDCSELIRVVDNLMSADSVFNEFYFDRGQTDYLLGQLSKATKGDELVLKDMLIKHSPLSDTVLWAVYGKKVLFSESSLLSIFSINSPLPDSLVDVIMGDDGFSQEFRDAVLYAQTKEREPVLETFEYMNGISSMRRALVDMESSYLRRGSSPDEIPEFFLEDDYLLSVLNSDAEIWVGSVIYKFLNERYMAWIPNGNLTALQALRNAMMKYRDNEIGTFMFSIPQGFSHLKFLYDLVSASTKIVVSDLSVDPSMSCKAKFNYLEDPSSPGRVQFINMSRTPLFAVSSSASVSFYWDFGDGTSSTDPSPVHTYANAGTYDVKLVMTYSGGPCGEGTCVDTFSMRVSVRSNCNAVFVVNYDPGQSYVELTDYSYTNCSGKISEWTIDWGDGTTQTFTAPPNGVLHSYYDDNPYTICMTIQDSCGCTSEYCFYVDIKACCKDYRQDTVFIPVTNKHIMKAKIAIRGSLGFFSYVVAKTKLFRKKGSVYLLSWAKNIGVSMNGEVWINRKDTGVVGKLWCFIPDYVSKQKYRRNRHKVKVLRRRPIKWWYGIMVKYQGLQSTHSVTKKGSTSQISLYLHEVPCI